MPIFHLGNGYNSVKGSECQSTAIRNKSVESSKKDEIDDIKCYTSLVYGSTEYYVEHHANANLKVPVGPISLSVEVDGSFSRDSSEHEVFFIMHFYEEEFALTLGSSVELQEKKEKLLVQNPERFFLQNGNSYISSVTYGRELIIVIKITTQNSQRKLAITSELSCDYEEARTGILGELRKQIRKADVICTTSTYSKGMGLITLEIDKSNLLGLLRKEISQIYKSIIEKIVTARGDETIPSVSLYPRVITPYVEADFTSEQSPLVLERYTPDIERGSKLVRRVHEALRLINKYIKLMHQPEFTDDDRERNGIEEIKKIKNMLHGIEVEIGETKLCNLKFIVNKNKCSLKKINIFGKLQEYRNSINRFEIGRFSLKRFEITSGTAHKAAHVSLEDRVSKIEDAYQISAAFARESPSESTGGKSILFAYSDRGSSGYVRGELSKALDANFSLTRIYPDREERSNVLQRPAQFLGRNKLYLMVESEDRINIRKEKAVVVVDGAVKWAKPDLIDDVSSVSSDEAPKVVSGPDGQPSAKRRRINEKA